MLAYLRNPLVRKKVVETTVLFGTSALISSAFAKYMYSVQVCKGPSMLPTLPTTREIVVVDKLSYGLEGRNYKYGDVVASISMNDPDKSKMSVVFTWCQILQTHSHFNYIIPQLCVNE